MMIRDGRSLQAAPGYLDWYQLEEGIVGPALDVAQSIDARSQTFNGPPSALPDGLRLLADIASEQAEQPFNTLSLYRYRPGEADGAYFWHISPEQYAGKVAVVSLSGFAKMDIERRGRIHTFDCYSGKMILTGADARRKSTPPERSLERRVAYLGFNVGETA